MKAKSLFVQGLIAVAVLGLAFVPAQAADDETPARVTIETMSAGLGLGVTWGEGVLEYRGQRYPFTVNGFNIGDVGVAKTSARGLVFNLKSVEDFSGMFATALAGGTLGGGAGTGAMYNQNKVSMVWTGTNQGLNFTLAHSGVNVQLTPEAKQQAARLRQNSTATVEGQQPAAAPRPSQ